MKQALQLLYLANLVVLPTLYFWSTLVYEKGLFREGIGVMDAVKAAGWFMAMSWVFVAFYLGLEPKRDVTGDQGWGFLIFFLALPNAAALACVLVYRAVRSQS